MNDSFWTIKIAGVSGTGKTTVMSGLSQYISEAFSTIIYSELLVSCGNQEAADMCLAETLEASTGLVLMDDHLEFDNPNKTQNYLRENTRGIVLLDVPLRDLIERIRSDESRKRNVEPRRVARSLRVSREKAIRLSRDTKIPLLVIPNLAGELTRSVSLIAAFINHNSP